MVLSEDSLSTQEAIFVRLLELLICAMDCDMERLGVPPGNTVVAAHAARPGHSSPAGDNTSAATAEDSAGVPTAEPAATFVFVREELVKYCANLGCVSWFSTVFNSFDGSTAAQLHVSVAVLNFLEFISRPAGGYAHFEQPKPGMGSKQERGAQTSLLHTMKVTEFGGIIPLLLTVLLNPEQNKAVRKSLRVPAFPFFFEVFSMFSRTFICSIVSAAGPFAATAGRTHPYCPSSANVGEPWLAKCRVSARNSCVARGAGRLYPPNKVCTRQVSRCIATTVRLRC